MAGPGGFGLRDDAAVVSLRPDEDLVVTVDALVEGVHFFPDDPPEAIAVKALGVNLSDLAAKAAEPTGFLLALALHDRHPAEWLARFAEGLRAAAEMHGCPLLGGDTVRTPGPLTLSITAFGTVPRGRMLPRTGAQPGDLIYVSGTIGDAALGLTLRLNDDPPALGSILRAGMQAEDLAHLGDRYLRPRPRLALRGALRDHAHAGMDVSDGLVGDLRKMLRVARVGGSIDTARIPLSAAAQHAVAIDRRAFETAVTGGDDYEILATVAPDHALLFERAAAEAGERVTRIGQVLAGSDEVLFHDLSGSSLTFDRGSFQHF
ncbi:thiamine-phosphate kinase [Lichenifustis flavocetrariae]|uniref:Thiamine-monophosphate kinase n=1 Tax=Lichenifustis flavocetrariae TaxID=2949735 RepID=A0AA41Z7K5_9HYPH|nr:thiamine-phosphate kinase [Lichenifustis flavocetrariae]MCW6510722.1 thiamine-phosphate kinase [Lichenifustis flavocetrariae]